MSETDDQLPPLEALKAYKKPKKKKKKKKIIKTPTDVKDSGNVLTDLKEWMVNKTKTHPDWAEAIALSLLSTAVGRAPVSTTEKGDVHTNLYFLYAAPSRSGHKSLPLKNVHKPVLEELDKLIYPEDSCKSLATPVLVSSESLVDYLNEYNKEGVFVYDEFTGLIKGARRKSYQADMIETLSDLFDGCTKKQYYKTENSDPKQANDVHFNVLVCAAFHIFSELEDSFLDQGIGNRFQYIFSASFLEEDFNVDTFLKKRYDHLEQLKSFAERLFHLREFVMGNAVVIEYNVDSEPLKRYQMFASDDANNVLVSYYNDRKRVKEALIANNPTDFRINSIAEQARTAQKVAMLSAIAARRPMILEEDVHYAIEIVNRFHEHFLGFYGQLKSMAFKEKPRSYQRSFENILRHIQEAGGWIKHGELMRKLNCNVKDLNDHTEALIAQGKIRQVQLFKKSGAKGKGASVYVLDHKSFLHKLAYNSGTTFEGKKALLEELQNMKS